jgi:uncharacterized protein (DUF3084 family)
MEIKLKELILNTPIYKRVLLKLSGEAISAEKDGILAAFTAEMREGVDSLLKGTEELKTRLATVETATAKKPRAPRKKKEAEVAPVEEVIELPTEDSDNK